MIFLFPPALDTDPPVTPKVLVAQAESSLAPEFWDLDQNHCRWSPEGLAGDRQAKPAGFPSCWAPSEKSAHTGQAGTDCSSLSAGGVKWELSRGRGLQRTLGESYALWWLLNKYWKLSDCWVVSHDSGKSMQEGAVRSHLQGKVYFSPFNPLVKNK